MVPCPRGLLIPEHIHEIPDVTPGPAVPGEAGGTGATGPAVSHLYIILHVFDITMKFVLD